MKNSDVDIEKNLALIKNQIQPDPHFVSQLKGQLEQFPLLEYRQGKTKRLLLFLGIGFIAIFTYIAGHILLDAAEDE